MTEFFTLTFLGFLVIVSPGPDFAVVTKISLTKGRVAGILSAVGVATANLCHVGLNLLGIGVIISQSLLAFTIMKFLGATYLLYIGYKGLRATAVPIPPKQTESKSKGSLASENSSTEQVSSAQGFISGFLTSLLNPKACLFYLSFFSVILSGSIPFLRQLFYGVWISSLACVWFMLVAIFFTHPYIGAKLNRGKHWIERITGGALVLLGLRLLGAKAIG